MFSNEASHTIVASPDVLVLVGVFWHRDAVELFAAHPRIVVEYAAEQKPPPLEIRIVDKRLSQIASAHNNQPVFPV